MGKARDYLLSALVLLVARRRRRAPHTEPRVVPPGTPSPRAETAAIVLLLLGSACAVGFVVVYAFDSIPRQTQFLGLTLGGALLCIAASLVVVASTVVVAEELVHEYPPLEYPGEQELIEEIVRESGDGFTRRRLFKLAAAGAGGALGLAAITPALSFGPLLSTKLFHATPWRRLRRLVDEQGRPLRADEIEEKTFYTAFPEGAKKNALAAPVVVVRVAKRDLRLPPELTGYAADGIVAYSKICTHAGCAISMYRAPLFAPDEPRRPALVCPCHYSTFDVADGGSVIFGPAGRRLPMLPLLVDSHGHLRAKGSFNEPVGPSWWGVRR